MNYSIDDLIKAITDRCENIARFPLDSCIVEYLKSIKTLKDENETLKRVVNNLKDSCSYQVYGNMCNVNAKLEDEIAKLKADNEKLAATIKTLKADRREMANTVSSAVWRELMDRAKNIEGPINTSIVGFGFNDISDVVLNKILDYKSENKTGKGRNLNLTVGKWYKCYANLTIPNVVRSCYMPTSIQGDFVFDGKFLVVPNASLIVKDDTVNYDVNTTVKYNPGVFDTIEELYKPVKKPRRMTNKELSDLMATGTVEKCYPHYECGHDLSKVYRTHTYYRTKEDSPCAKSILIRYNGTNKWVQPLVEE